MIQSGNVHPICSPSSYAIVFLPSMRYGSLSVDTSNQPSGRPRLGRDPAGVGDQAVDERHVRAVQLALADERHLDVLRHEDLRLQPGGRGVGRQRVGGVAADGTASIFAPSSSRA